MTLQEAITAANDADKAFAEAIMAAGFKSRWDWNDRTAKNLSIATSDLLLAAYRGKVDADNAMHEAFETSRTTA